MGGLEGSVVGDVGRTNDFAWVFAGISTAAPTFFNFFYSSTLAPLSLFDSQTGTVSVTPLVTAVPEPTTFALVAIGLIGLVLRHRKQLSAYSGPTSTA